MVSHDAAGAYHIARLSHFDTPEGKGWDRSPLDRTHPSRHTQLSSEEKRSACVMALPDVSIAMLPTRVPVDELIGPETADRAIGCERCHGPGGNHLAALQAGFPDSAIVNPAGASSEKFTRRQCNECHILDKVSATATPITPAGFAPRASAGR